MDFQTSRTDALASLSQYRKATFAHYGAYDSARLFVIADGISVADHLEKRRRAVQSAKDLPALSAALAKAKDSVLTTTLYLWAKGQASGPAKPENVYKGMIEREARIFRMADAQTVADEQEAAAEKRAARVSRKPAPAPATSQAAKSSAARKAWETRRARRAA